LKLEVAAGSLVILLGPSGCGKTTLLSCLGGILRPKSGTIKFDGVDVTALEHTALAHYRRDKVGIVFQAFNLVPSLSAVENVMVPLRAAGSPPTTAGSCRWPIMSSSWRPRSPRRTGHPKPCI
jgi:putative ABC transport system ATP-binding protein